MEWSDCHRTSRASSVAHPQCFQSCFAACSALARLILSRHISTNSSNRLLDALPLLLLHQTICFWNRSLTALISIPTLPCCDSPRLLLRACSSSLCSPRSLLLSALHNALLRASLSASPPCVAVFRLSSLVLASYRFTLLHGLNRFSSLLLPSP